MLRNAVLAALVLLPLGLGGCAPREEPAATAEAPVPWPKTPCRGSVEAFLGMGGLSLARMEAVRVREDRLAGGQPGEAVGSWLITGQPVTCAKGDIALTILPNCAIQSWKASGGCRVAGLEPGR